MTKIGQYGVPRSGTNAVKAILEHNLIDVFVDDSRKHGRNVSLDGAAGYVVNVKEPVSWVWSYYRYLRFVHNEQRDLQDCPLSEWLEYWESRTLAHLSLVEYEKCVVIQHEDLVRDPLGVLHQVAHRFAIPQHGNTDVFMDGYAKRGGGRYGSELIDRGKVFRRDYHLDGIWRDDMPKEAMAYCERFAGRVFERYPLLRIYMRESDGAL